MLCGDLNCWNEIEKECLCVCVCVCMCMCVCVCVCACLVTQSCLTLQPHGLYVAHQTPLPTGILQARILEWVAMPSSRGSSQPRDQTQVSRIAGRFFTV